MSAILNAIQNLKDSLQDTENELDAILESYEESFNNDYPPGINPIDLLGRFKSIQQRQEALQQSQESLNDKKKELAVKINAQLQENKQLMNKLLTLTEYSGDYEAVDVFQNQLLELLDR
ncbi:hypothetical protein HDV06_005512 [Boothiomyces sp. JEL0866]|nr:hypothetical protein HDV06_005512 [Boothiomyces sp. JEL0866]